MVIGIDIDETITNTHDEAYKYVKNMHQTWNLMTTAMILK